MSVKSGQSNGTVEVTPSGIPVYFQSKPKRLYRIAPCDVLQAPDIDRLIESAQAEDTGWVEVPSVSTVLDMLDKSGPLIWWGQGIGIQGLSTLIAMNVVQVRQEPGLQPTLLGPDAQPIGWEGIVALLVKHQLSTNHQRDKASDRGQAVHDVFEEWARHGTMPNPAMFPPTERGYVEGLVAFLKDVPTAEPLGTEVLVASREHGFAGRYDIRFRTHKPHKVVVHRTPVRGPQYRVLPPSLLLGDLKSSKGVYVSHARQLAGYEVASVESGYEPTDAQGIIHVSAEGEYEFVRSWGTARDFLVVLDLLRSEEEMKTRKKAAK